LLVGFGGDVFPKEHVTLHYSPECVEGEFCEVRMQDPA
jgi:hypothetical protein